jgi:hypothetical protein
VRFVLPAACLLVVALRPVAPSAQAGAGCAVSGTIASGSTLLPGVVVSVLDADNRALDVSASNADGTYTLRIPGPGRYTLKAEFVAFAAITRELTVDQTGCQQRLDLAMTLASRVPKAPAVHCRGCTGARRRPAGPAWSSHGQGASRRTRTGVSKPRVGRRRCRRGGSG